MTCACDMNGRGRLAHCRTCCLTFGSVGSFDRHIVRGTHETPQDRGLHPDTNGIWRLPGKNPAAEASHGA